MSRRKKTPRPPRSTHWESYPPTDGLYWRLGGPFIPEADIVVVPFDARGTGATMKNPASRARYVLELIEAAETDLAEARSYYRKLEEMGIEAMKFAWYRDEDHKLDASPGDWTLVSRNVDRHRASSYREIGHRQGKIAALRKLLEEIETVNLPLLFGRGREK